MRESAPLAESVLAPVRAVGFWAAIGLPFLYVPLLLTGIETRYETMASLSLVVLNVAALVVGHTYRR
jgi:hypothetical protein